MAGLSKEQFASLLERARANVSKQQVDNLDNLAKELHNVQEISFNSTGISNSDLQAGDSISHDTAVEIIRDVADNISKQQNSSVPDGEDLEQSGSLHKQMGVARDITLNTLQQQAHDLILSGADCNLLGAAGTGKTTSMKKVTQSLLSTPGRLPVLTEEDETRWLVSGAPGAVIVSFTRKAVNNIRHAVVPELRQHTLTIHKLIEFRPVKYTIEDPDNPGQFKNTMVFEPSRNADNPLPRSLIFIAHEESSMEGVPLYAQLEAAMPHPHQEVFLGDIQQLPPVFGSAILGFKMISLPTVELTEVYRQALDSPILALAHKILKGDPNDFISTREKYQHSLSDGREVTRFRVPSYDKLSGKQLDADGNVLSELIIQPWQKKLSVDDGVNTVIKQLTVWSDSGYYNPEDDIILCPFNQAFGTIELNKGIAQHLGVRRNALIYEVIAGFNKHYLAVGDRVLYDKEDAYITGINKNGSYLGASPKAASHSLDRWGHYRSSLTEEEQLQYQLESEMDLDHLDLVMEAAAATATERVTASSHVITISYAYGDREEEFLDSAAEVNNLLGGYALTTHKFQGSENDRGFIVLHHSHAVLNSREMLYTAVSRYKEFVHIICEPDTFEKGVASQRIKGNSLAEKIEHFKGKIDAGFKLEDTEKNGGEFTKILEAQMHKYSQMQQDGRNHQRLEELTKDEPNNIVGYVNTDSECSSVASHKEIISDNKIAIVDTQVSVGTMQRDIVAEARARLAAIRTKKQE